MRRSVLDFSGREAHHMRIFVPVFLMSLVLILMPQVSFAQATTEGVWDYFGTETGDAYSSMLFNQIFGPLFPSAAGGVEKTLFSEVIAYFNVMILLIGGLMFFYNVTIGILQSAHEGQVLGSRWSSLWSPLRVIFAVGLLVPVNEGYNLAQTGIAYVVRGATMMASNVWSATATAVLQDDIPVAAPRVEFDADLLYTMYQQAACMTVVGSQFAIANGADESSAVSKGGNYVTWKRELDTSGIESGGSAPTSNVDALLISHISYINLDGKLSDAEICGSFTTPRIPLYIENLLRNVYDGTSIEDGLMTRERAIEVAKAFNKGHEKILLDVRDALKALTDSYYDQLRMSDIDPASLAPEIAEIHVSANEALAELQEEVRTRATAGDFGTYRIRKEVLDRVTGGSCTSSSGSSESSSLPGGSETSGPSASIGEDGAGSSSNEDGKFSCYGEGWMGAGSWYILIAKINNELTTLVDAESSASAPEFRSRIIDVGFIRSVREFFGSERASVTSEEAGVVLQRYNDIFETAQRELAALGYKVPTALFTRLQEETSDSFFRDTFIMSIIPESLMKDGTRVLMDFFDPASGGGDPMFGLINLGNWLILTGTAIMVASVVASALTFGGAAIAFLPLYSVILTAGVTLSYILPVMPFLYWILAITGYLLITVEAVIAVNLWALGHMRMDGEGISGEQGRQGWLMILSLFMTPVLMVFGFIVGMIIFRVGSDLISAGMFYAVAMLLGANPLLWLMGTVGFAILIAAVYVILLERSFSLVSEFPNRVLRWIGSNVDVTGGESRIQVAAGGAAMGINQIGNAIEKAMGKVGKDGKFERGVGLGGRMRNAGDRFLNRTENQSKATKQSESDSEG